MSTNYLFTHNNQFIGSSFAMDERAKTIGANVKRLRTAAKESHVKLARAIGVKSGNTINEIEHGRTRESKHLPKIARHYKVNLADIDPEFEQGDLVIVPGPQLFGQKDGLEVFGTEEVAEGTLSVSKNPVGKIDRPFPLANVSGGYGLIVPTDAFSPELKRGDTALINEHKPPRLGDLCLFRSADGGRGCLAEYHGETKELWKVKRQSKANITNIKKSDWPKRHLIVGRYNG